MNYLDKPLFTFEMANNHMGDVNHGLKIIKEFAKFIDLFPEFNFSIKLQYRDIKFFHPDHFHRKDHKLIKRFTETILSDIDFKALIDEMHSQKFISQCTPWDRDAVDYQIKMGVEIIKIASCSFTDWDLLEKISSTNHPIIASTAGATADDIKNVYSFFKNREKDFAFLHCVGEYPCTKEHLELNQINYLQNLYEDIPIGYSTHEDPNNFDSIKIAIAKNAKIFEKHIGIKTNRYDLNAYSANPDQAYKWLEAARDSYLMCGGDSQFRKDFSEKELDDLRILYRGAYAKIDLKRGDFLRQNYFLAMPNINNQLVAKDLGKFKKFTLTTDVKANTPIMLEYVEIDDTKSTLNQLRHEIKTIISNASLTLPKNINLEISHHYGLNRFREIGAVLIHLINREYSKIIVVMLPHQCYPVHKHNQKDETYYILYGKLKVNINNEEIILLPGQTFSVERGNSHSFSALENGVVFEEIATTYIKGDSVYDDLSINSNAERKTLIRL